jgi:membrane protein YqaA with SNARE-associated domain
MTGDECSLLGLFLSAFLSSTILPGTSEVVFVVLATQGDLSAWNLLAIATAGNTLGGMSSWALGWLISWWYPLTELSKPAQRLAVERVRHWGSPVLLLSWVPFIGDPLCIAAGWLRITWVGALLFIGIGKGCRYAVLLALLPANGG